MFVLERPCLGLMTPSSSPSMLWPMVPELLIASILSLWPVVFWPVMCLGVLMVEPLQGPLHSFLLLDLLWAHLLLAGNDQLPPHKVDSWCHSESLVSLGEIIFQCYLWGHPHYARSSRDSWLFLPQSGL